MTPDESLPQTAQVLATLGELLYSSESDTARIAAAKLLLDRIAPKQDDEAQKHEAAERDAAVAEARGLLAEFAALKLASLRASRALDQTGAPETTDSAGQLAGVADYGGQGLGQDAHGG